VTQTKETTTGTGRQGSGRGARRAALVAVAKDLFSRKAYDEIFIEEIAREAGVAHGLLFYHFKDKRGLYLEVLRQVVDEVIGLHLPADGEDTPIQRLQGVIRRHIEYRRDHVHTTLALMRAAGQDPEIDDLFEQARAAGAAFILDLAGIEQPPPPRVRAAVRGCMGFVDEMTADWLAHDSDLEVDELVELAHTAVVEVLSAVCTRHSSAKGIADGL
jgi:AcrR family transcriptional regulator